MDIKDQVTQSALWCTRGGAKVKHLYATVCASYGIHYVANTVTPLREDERTSKEYANRTGVSWCGPHKIVKLAPMRGKKP